MLLDAFKRVLANTREVASAVVAVDAKDDRARAFYLSRDFISLPSYPNRLFYSVKTIEKLFGARRKPNAISDCGGNEEGQDQNSVCN